MSYKDRSFTDIFAKELATFSDPEVAIIVNKTFERVLERHKWEPASSSGKYHPKCDLGDGGLIRHSKIVFQFADELLRATPILKSEYDVIRAAALLHDMFKYKTAEEEHTSFEHPTDAANAIKEANPNSPKADEIARLVSKHMGIWNTSSYHPDITLPVPEKFDEWVLHYADLLASRRYIDFTFDDDGNLVI